VEKENVTVRMNPALHNKVKAIASEAGASMSDWILRAIIKQLPEDSNVTTEEEPEERQGNRAESPASSQA